MTMLTIDFETFYSKEIGFSKQTTEEYIRDPQFEVIGVSVQVDDGEPVWCSGNKVEICQFLKSFNMPNHAVLAHNAVFDGAILSWVYGIKPKIWFDTLSMGRALHGTEVGGSLAVLATHYDIGVKGIEVENAIGLRRRDFSEEHLARYGEYCKNDVDLTYKLFVRMMAGFPFVELELIDLTIRMFTQPTLQLNEEVLATHLTKVKAQKTDSLGTHKKDDLMSNPKFAELLKALGVEPPTKISLRTGKTTLALAKNDEGFKKLLNHEDPLVSSLVAARLGTKSTIEESRTERFIEVSKRGLLPVPLRYYAAHTGRWGGDDKINLQNLPRKSPLKKAIEAPKGFVVVDSDSSQIEARTLAWLAGQDDLVEAFEKGEDVYKIMASAIYSKAVEEITQDERFVGKTTILGAGYGMGAIKFKAQLAAFNVEISKEDSQNIINIYRKTYPNIAKLWKTADKTLTAIADNKQSSFGWGDLLKIDGSNGILLPNNLYVKYPNLRLAEDEKGKNEWVYDTKKGKQTIPNKIYGGKIVENVCQALARIVIGEQMIEISKKYRVVMTVHDAIAIIAPESEAEEAKAYIETCMRARPKWAPDLPLNCEAGYGKSYGDC